VFIGTDSVYSNSVSILCHWFLSYFPEMKVGLLLNNFVTESGKKNSRFTESGIISLA
jgi:hypothetical protein